MKRVRFAEEQIIGILKAAETSGNIRSCCAEHDITEQTFYRWRRRYGGMEVSEARKLKDLERVTSFAGTNLPTGLPHTRSIIGNRVIPEYKRR